MPCIVNLLKTSRLVCGIFKNSYCSYLLKGCWVAKPKLPALYMDLSAELILWHISLLQRGIETPFTKVLNLSVFVFVEVTDLILLCCDSVSTLLLLVFCRAAVLWQSLLPSAISSCSHKLCSRCCLAFVGDFVPLWSVSILYCTVFISLCNCISYLVLKLIRCVLCVKGLEMLAGRQIFLPQVLSAPDEPEIIGS